MTVRDYGDGSRMGSRSRRPRSVPGDGRDRREVERGRGVDRGNNRARDHGYRTDSRAGWILMGMVARSNDDAALCRGV